MSRCPVMARPRHRARPARSGRLRAAVGFGVVATLGVGGTWAHWNDQVTIAGTRLTAGTVDLRVNGQDAVTGYTALTLTAMVPGSSAAAVLTVSNAGTAPVKFTGTSTATNADGKGLGAALRVKVTADAAVTGSAPAATCAGTALTGSGTALNGPLLSTGRLLAPGATSSLCVQVTLPDTAASSLQGATTDVVLTLTATTDLS